MKNIPRVQAVLLAAYLACIVAAGVFVGIPLSGKAVGLASSLRDRWRFDAPLELSKARQEARMLNSLNDQLRRSENDGAAEWYRFLQEMMKKHATETDRIQSTGTTDAAGLEVGRFSFATKTNYHALAGLLSDLENGPYVCRIVALHIVARSLMSSDVDADLTAAFFKRKK